MQVERVRVVAVTLRLGWERVRLGLGGGFCAWRGLGDSSCSACKCAGSVWGLEGRWEGRWQAWDMLGGVQWRIWEEAHDRCRRQPMVLQLLSKF
jgi:hypothetical protein